jgi:hypothetical protein
VENAIGSSSIHRKVLNYASLVELKEKDKETEDIKSYIVSLMVLDRIVWVHSKDYEACTQSEGDHPPIEVSEYDGFRLRDWGNDWKAQFEDSVKTFETAALSNKLAKACGIKAIAIQGVAQDEQSSRRGRPLPNLLNVSLYLEWAFSVCYDLLISLSLLSN